jgi:dCTP diphosphatase
MKGPLPASEQPHPPMKDLQQLRASLRAFALAREWERFHSPKNLAMALSVEAAEILEHFQWLTEQESESLDGEIRDAVEKELADVLIYLVRLADRLEIDLLAAAAAKIESNERKYPVQQARGNARKYTTFSDKEDGES